MGLTQRQPVDVVVLMDTSGSMAAAGKLSYAKQAAREAVGMLEGDDRFGLVTFSRQARVTYPSMPVEYSRAQAHMAIDSVVAQGDTNISEALRLGAEQLAADGDPSGRLLLLSDGIATAGTTEVWAMEAQAQRLAEQGISVSAIGLGLEHDERLLTRVALAGGGDYEFVDSPHRLASVLRDDVSRQVQAVARDTRVEVELPDGVELVQVVGWSATQRGRTLSIPVGDLAAGESKRVVAEVRVRAPEALGVVDVAHVRAAWYDLPDADSRQASASATAAVTTAVAEVERSANREAQTVSAQVVAAGLLTKAAEAFSSGDAAEAEALAGEGLAVLEAAPKPAPDAPIAEVMEAQKVRMKDRQELYMATKPTSAAGRTAVLEDVSDAYDWAH